MEPWLIVVLTILGVIVARGILALILSGGDVQRIRLAVQASWRLLRDPEFGAKVLPLLEPTAAKPAKPSGAPLRLLALLQREGRLLDFLLEDVQAYGDEQIGAAARDIHRQCQAALREHLVLEPVLDQEEGATVTVPVGFDPSAIRVVGNVTGEPPFQGTLRHHGWRVREIKLAPPPEGQDEFVVMPAEVELP
ncbi:MAG: DUF2760 domain-containing protein [Gemmataceae bacterium]